MQDAFNRTLELAAQGLAWIPTNAIGFALIAVAILVAFTLHNTVVRLLRRRLAARFPYAVSLLGTAHRVTRFALMLFAASAVLPVAPLDAGATVIVGKSLLLCTITLAGWVALVAANLAADVYLLRFRLDTDDNLLFGAGRAGARATERARQGIETGGRPRGEPAGLRRQGSRDRAARTGERADLAARMGPALRGARETDRVPAARLSARAAATAGRGRSAPSRRRHERRTGKPHRQDHAVAATLACRIRKLRIDHGRTRDSPHGHAAFCHFLYRDTARG